MKNILVKNFFIKHCLFGKKPLYKEKQIIRKGILHAASPKEETAW